MKKTSPLNKKGSLAVYLIIGLAILIIGGLIGYIIKDNSEETNLGKDFISAEEKAGFESGGLEGGDWAPVICEIDSNTKLSNDAECTLEYVKDLIQFQLISDRLLEAYKLQDKDKLLELRSQMQNLEIAKGTCIIQKGSASEELGEHTCNHSPQILSTKPPQELKSSRDKMDIPTISSTYNSFSGISCDKVETYYDGEKYIVYCSRECLNAEIKLLGCEYVNSVARVTVERAGIAPIVGLSFSSEYEPPSEDGPLGFNGMKISDFPEPLERKIIEIPIIDGIPKLISVTPMVKSRFSSTLNQGEIKVCGGDSIKSIECTSK
ncbi:MAG: hypothetical protein Q7S27_01655 [Nanoarchaeota archaeon]|nr:hypothetical protein [Nanoarchaeota archaeon]